jgi:hypothetical protein
MQKLKENLPIIVGLSIPVVMVLVIAGVIYGQQMFSSVPAPTQNFVYALGNTVIGVPLYGYAPSMPGEPCAKEYYRVASGTIKKFPTDPKERDAAFCKGAYPEQSEPMFFVYDVVTKKNTQLTFEEASKLVINNVIKSKDGYEYTQNVNRGDSGIFGLFGGGNYDYNARYLKNGSHYEKINLQLPERYSYGGDVFLGWVAQ